MKNVFYTIGLAFLITFLIALIATSSNDKPTQGSNQPTVSDPQTALKNNANA